MKRWYSMLLLIGALVGLFGQEAAFASGPLAQPVEQASPPSGMSVDCAEMMGLAKSQPDQPCQGLTFDCIAKMGCGLSLALVPPTVSSLPSQYREGIPAPLPVAPLIGRNLSPEPEPPARLG